MRGAELSHANLMASVFEGGDFAHIVVTSGELGCATFNGTNLTGADFSGADIRKTAFVGANVHDAKFAGANLDGASYDPRPGALPDIGTFTSTQNLQGLTYQQSPQQLSELREALYKGGLSSQARQITFAIEHTRRLQDSQRSNLLDRALSWIQLIAFEWPVGYGMYPFRPLLVLLLLIPIFTPVYMLAIYGGERGRIWIRRSDGAINHMMPERWTPVWIAMETMVPWRWLNTARFALWFSINCAFRIGYRDVNVGDWITRLQPREYLLGATGWCRTISAVQSLLSVYLLALTVLCIIGRPFG
jgi:hypothetical protein